ncbi:MAG: P-loop NTPase [Firmicutes bacterium]|nr:P-loop NTPase [Bacillota bacterium]
MIVAIASGKGGTGKTTIATNMALTLEEAMPTQILDCDVEEPNAHLFLNPAVANIELVTLPVPVVDETRCDVCGRCSAVCAFHAILVMGGRVLAFPELCHGCGGCSLFCPTGAISEKPIDIGVVESGWAGGDGRINFVHGKLKVGRALAPPVIRAVKRKAHSKEAYAIIIDAPPGTSCPVVASMVGSDFCLLVTEPTPFGLNDLVLAVEMVKALKIPFGVLINRSGLGDEELKAYCEQNQIPILLEIPFDRRYAACYARGGRLVEEFPELKEALRGLWQKIEKKVGVESKL